MNERIANIAQAISFALVAWIGYSVVEMKSDIAGMKATLVVAADDRYRRSDAMRDFANASEHRHELERRIEALEKVRR